MKKTKFKQTEIGLIPEDWEVVTIPEVSSNFDSNRKPLSSSERSKMKGKFPYYGAAGVIDYVNEFRYEGDYLLIAEDGTVTSDGSKPMLQLPHGKFWVSNHAHVLQCKSYNDTLFLYYQLKHTNIIPFITGAVQPKLSQENLNKIKLVWINEDSERHSVTKILSDLDSKIELNQQMNKTLEAIGQAIFKRWFVDFEFPNEEGKPYKSSGGKMVDSELGKIPKGWIVDKLCNYVETISGCPYTSKGLEKSKTALVTLKSIGIDSFRQEGFKEYTGDYKEKHIVKDGDVVVAHTDLTQNRIILGKPAIVRDIGVYDNLVISMDLSVVRPTKLFNRPFVFYLLSTNQFHTHAQRFANGTTVIHLNRKAIPEYKFVVPTKELIIKFENLIMGFPETIRINDLSVFDLSQIRDLLLPKLMSGKIRVPVEVQK